MLVLGTPRFRSEVTDGRSIRRAEVIAQHLFPLAVSAEAQDLNRVTLIGRVGGSALFRSVHALDAIELGTLFRAQVAADLRGAPGMAIWTRQETTPLLLILFSMWAIVPPSIHARIPPDSPIAPPQPSLTALTASPNFFTSRNLHKYQKREGGCAAK